MQDNSEMCTLQLRYRLDFVAMRQTNNSSFARRRLPRAAPVPSPRALRCQGGPAAKRHLAHAKTRRTQHRAVIIVFYEVYFQANSNNMQQAARVSIDFDACACRVCVYIVQTRPENRQELQSSSPPPPRISKHDGGEYEAIILACSHTLVHTNWSKFKS